MYGIWQSGKSPATQLALEYGTIIVSSETCDKNATDLSALVAKTKSTKEVQSVVNWSIVPVQITKTISADSDKVRKAIEKTKGFSVTAGAFNISPSDHNGLGTDSFSMFTVKKRRISTIERINHSLLFHKRLYTGQNHSFDPDLCFPTVRIKLTAD